MVRILTIVCFLWIGGVVLAQDDERQWSDSTGRFKVIGTLVEVKDGDVILQSNGKMMKIPLSRLSQADRDFLDASDSPFQVMDANEVAAIKKSDSKLETSGSSNAALWRNAWSIDWENTTPIDRGFGEKRGFAIPEVAQLELPSKRAILPPKQNFFEDIRTMAVNPIANRAVVGYTVGFSVPKPLSRLSLVDLATGKAVNTAPIECDMCPLALLNDGSTVLMYGTGKDPNYGTGDQIQLWKVKGRNVTRSGIWVPFPDAIESFGRKHNDAVAAAFSTSKNNLVLLSGSGHLACFDLVSRKCSWHERLSNVFAVEMSADRKLLFVLDGASIMIMNPDNGDIKSIVLLEDNTRATWPQIAISPDGKTLLVCLGNEIRLLDLTTGQWKMRETIMHDGLLSSSGVAFADNDYALFGNSLLVHLPTMTKVCSYTSARMVKAMAGNCYVTLLGNEGGLMVPIKLPHANAVEALKKAQTNPNLFVIRPGVEVVIDVNGIPLEYKADIAEQLEKAALDAGYKVTLAAPVRVVAEIIGPQEEAVNFHRGGHHVFIKHTSSVRLVWENKNIWFTSGHNVPTSVEGDQNQSFVEALKSYEAKMNLYVFQHARFPRRVQIPSDDPSNKDGTLIKANFTLQGLVDNNQ